VKVIIIIFILILINCENKKEKPCFIDTKRFDKVFVMCMSNNRAVTGSDDNDDTVDSCRVVSLEQSLSGKFINPYNYSVARCIKK